MARGWDILGEGKQEQGKGGPSLKSTTKGAVRAGQDVPGPIGVAGGRGVLGGVWPRARSGVWSPAGWTCWRVLLQAAETGQTGRREPVTRSDLSSPGSAGGAALVSVSGGGALVRESRAGAQGAPWAPAVDGGGFWKRL